MFENDDRGQTFTMEAFIAAILLVSTVAFALHAVAITPNTAGTTDTELRSQHVGLAEGVLDRAVANGDLTTTLVYWDETEERFHGADENEGFYVSGHPNTTFGDSMATMFDDAQVQYNINLYYWDENGDQRMQRLVESGTPSPDAVRVVETVTLYDDTVLVDTDETPRENATLESVADGFYAPDVAADSSLHNVVRVEVVLWRT